MERIPFISFIGPEGSGKTTQARILSKKLNLTYISTGDMIRDTAKNDPGKLGQACRDMFEQHNYLPGPLLLKIVENRLKKEDIEKGVVFDGGFRTLEETRNLADTLKNIGRDFDIVVIFLRLPYWKSFERIGNSQRTRDDDTPEAILSRLSSFHFKLGERVSYIRNKWDLVVINEADESIEGINRKIIQTIKLKKETFS